MAKVDIPILGSKPPRTPGGSPARSGSGRRSGGGSGGGGKSRGGGGSSKSGGSSKDSVSPAEKRAVARENEAKRKAGKRYLVQAKNLEAQAKALQDALKTEFARARDQNLRDVALRISEQLGILKQDAALRAGTLISAAKDTEKATAGATEEGFGNLVRERQDSMTAVLEHGAGETDALRAMVMSARNWSANQSEINRGYFDTLASVNQGIVDLNVDTKSALANAAARGESDRESIWESFYGRRSETYTQLGNIRGQQADYYAQAKEMGVKPGKGAEARATKEMKSAYDAAANEAGKSYVQKALPAWIQNYQGTAQVARRQTNTNLGAVEFEQADRAEGATLRKWES